MTPIEEHFCKDCVHRGPRHALGGYWCSVVNTNVSKKGTCDDWEMKRICPRR